MEPSTTHRPPSTHTISIGCHTDGLRLGITGDCELELTSAVPPPDLQLYLDLCRRGELYTHLMRAAGYGPDRTKRWFKTQLWFWFFYGQNKTPEQCRRRISELTSAAAEGPQRRKRRQRNADDYRLLIPLLEAFAQQFPTVDAYVRKMKARGDRKTKVRGHQKFACDMQKLEAMIIIGTVVRWPAEHYPHVPVSTIHDCVLTTRQHAELVKNLTAMAFEAHGFQRPHLHDEPAGGAEPISEAA